MMCKLLPYFLHCPHAFLTFLSPVGFATALISKIKMVKLFCIMDIFLHFLNLSFLPLLSIIIG